MTFAQFAIARSARQVAENVIAGQVVSRKDRRYAATLFDWLDIHLAELSEGELAALAPFMAPIWQAQRLRKIE